MRIAALILLVAIAYYFIGCFVMQWLNAQHRKNVRAQFTEGQLFWFSFLWPILLAVVIGAFLMAVAEVVVKQLMKK